MELPSVVPQDASASSGSNLMPPTEKGAMEVAVMLSAAAEKRPCRTLLFCPAGQNSAISAAAKTAVAFHHLSEGPVLVIALQPGDHDLASFLSVGGARSVDLQNGSWSAKGSPSLAWVTLPSENEPVTAAQLKSYVDAASRRFATVILIGTAENRCARTFIAARLCQTAVLVVRSGHTTRSHVRYAQQTLSQMNVPIGGFVLDERG
jgi:hypothetical protein